MATSNETTNLHTFEYTLGKTTTKVNEPRIQYSPGRTLNIESGSSDSPRALLKLVFHKRWEVGPYRYNLQDLASVTFELGYIQKFDQNPSGFLEGIVEEVGSGVLRVNGNTQNGQVFKKDPPEEEHGRIEFKVVFQFGASQNPVGS